ncbi:hypothetical protein DL764_001288 [Monosporascus ibericus]|uniref:MAPEG family protein n=1 Tax=Monosporascus ibericus TaxID=155417 RepID=A0A4V1XCD9_9PEZI|nr:hypothetical protein DL764_001288 [Monosporascus ibericus]
MASLVDLSKNYSLFSIPVAVVLGLLPSFYGKGVAVRKRLYDNGNPRGYQDNVKNAQNIDNITKNRLLRCEAASTNAQETLPLFMGSVLAANMAGVPAPTVNGFAAAYLASRAVYNFVYVFLQDDPRFADLRSYVWITGVGLWMTLFVKAGLRSLEANSAGGP